MSARKRFAEERPFADLVVRSAEHLAKTPMLPDQARTAGLYAIAHAILDLSDAVREHGRKDDR
ncbi:hypothetical protein [Brachybacterium phenoliresistens]|uniref:hypothetical protein n=1 Tax=Brachybacterium phenoliresistens TaxID=396014 RepID=UPI0031E06B22